MILCGSILPSNFDWKQCEAQISGVDDTGQYLVINDCGKKDIWPLLAESTTYGYGSSGRKGFNSPNAKNRFFNYSHSRYLKREHFETFWKPFLTDSKIIESPKSPGTYTKYWLTLFNFILSSIKHLITVWCILLLILIPLGFLSNNFCSKDYVNLIPGGKNACYLTQESVEQKPVEQTDNKDIIPLKSLDDEVVLSDEELEKRFGQIFLVGFDGNSFNSDEITSTEILLKSMGIGGIFFNRRNLLSKQKDITKVIDGEALIEKILRIKKYLKTDFGDFPFVAVDHEGGVASQLMKYRITSQIPSAMAMASYNNLKIIDDVAEINSQELLAIGFNMILGPVLDLNNEWQNTDIVDRSYSGEATKVSEITSRIVDIYNKYNLISVAKHFPGHGATLTGFETPGLVTTRQTPRTIKNSMEPFRKISTTVPGIMTSHMKILKLGIDNVTTDSRVVQGLLRNSSKKTFKDSLLDEEHEILGLGFDGLIVADNLNEVSLTASPKNSCEENKESYLRNVYEKSLEAFDAGHNILLYSHIFEGFDDTKDKNLTDMAWIIKADHLKTCYRWALSTSEFYEVFKMLKNSIFNATDERIRHKRMTHLKDSLRKISKIKEKYNVNIPSKYNSKQLAKNYLDFIYRNESCSKALMAYSFTTFSDRKRSSILSSIRSINASDNVVLFSFVNDRIGVDKKMNPKVLGNRYHSELINVLKTKLQGGQLHVKQLKQRPAKLEFQILEKSILEFILSKKPTRVIFLLDKIENGWPVVLNSLKKIKNNEIKDVELSRTYALITRNPLIIKQDSTEEQRQALLAANNIILFSNYLDGAILQYNTIFKPSRFTLINNTGLENTQIPFNVSQISDVTKDLISTDYSCN